MYLIISAFILAHESYTVNLDFEGLSLRELTDSSMSFWVHHTQHILPQGRCTWFNPYEKPEDDFEEEEFDEEEDENAANISPPETGPQLLSSVASDVGKLLITYLNCHVWARGVVVMYLDFRPSDLGSIPGVDDD